MAAGSREHDSARDGLQLEANLPDWCALNWQQTLIGCSFVLLFMWSNYLPVPTTATWNAIQHGKTISETSLFNTELANSDLLPLSSGLRNFRIGTLAQWVIFQVHQIGGLEILSAAFAVLRTICCVMWALLLTRVSNRWWLAFLPVAFFMLPIHGQGMSTFLIGQLCLVSMLNLLVTTPDLNDRINTFQIASHSLARWIAVAVAIVVWCNSDPSFVLSWLLLLTLVVSRLIRCMVSKTIRWQSDRELRCRLILFEIGLVVSLLTPAGTSLWSSLLWYPDQPIWLHFGTWKPLSFSGIHGIVVSSCIFCWIICSRKATEIAPWQWLFPLVCMLVMAINESMVSILALPFAWAGLSMLPHRSTEENVAEISEPSTDETPVLKFGLSLSFGLLVWLAFAFSPASTLLLGGQGRSINQQFGAHSPHIALNKIQEIASSASQAPFIMTPRYWSDQVIANVESVSVFASSEPHLLPAKSNTDYETIFNGQYGWQRLLDRYSVDLLLVDVELQLKLLRNLRSRPGSWNVVHVDEVAAVYRRSDSNE